jgi:hypothetical protein
VRLEVPRLLLCVPRVVPRLLLSCDDVVVPLVREELLREALPLREVDEDLLSLLRVAGAAEELFLLLSVTLPLREEVLELRPVVALPRSVFVEGVDTRLLLLSLREVLVPRVGSALELREGLALVLPRLLLSSVREVELLPRLLLSSERVAVPSRPVLLVPRLVTLLPRVLPSFTTPVRLGAAEVVPRPVVRSVTVMVLSWRLPVMRLPLRPVGLFCTVLAERGAVTRPTSGRSLYW